MTDSFKESALRYHTHPLPGKLEIRPTKPLANKRDLSLAYSPGGRLLAAAIDLAENWLNVTRLELTVFTDNRAAIALYEKHGFRIEGESPGYALRDGVHASVYHMARIKDRQ